MNEASASVHLDEGALSFDNLRVVRDEGIGTGSITYDFAHHEVRTSKTSRARCARPTRLSGLIRRYLKDVAPYKFRQPPNLVVNGVSISRGPTITLEIKVDAPAGMDYVFLGKTLPFDRVSGRLLFTDDRLQLTISRAKLFSGDVRGAADISLARNDKHYHANLTLDGVDFPRLADLYFKYKTAYGPLERRLRMERRRQRSAGSWTARGPRKSPTAMSSRSRSSARLSDLISAIIPGAGYSLARQAKSTFTIRNGVIHTDDFKVSGKLFGMVGHGDIHFLEDKLDFDIRIDAGGPGVRSHADVQTFRIQRRRQHLDKPNWHPKRF